MSVAVSCNLSDGVVLAEVRHEAMPIDEAVSYARFLVELVINHHRFTSRDALVGGEVQIGKVDYRQGSFELSKPPEVLSGMGWAVRSSSSC